MLTFPQLKTGSVVQYPFAVNEAFSTEVLEFLAGDEQRYLVRSGGLKTWQIKLSLLDEGEIQAIEEFFVTTAGSYTTFSFVDPSTGISYPNCIVDSDSITEQFDSELRGSISLAIRQLVQL